MKTTPSTIDALEGAIEMLTKIKGGGSYNVVEYIERLQSYQAARDEHRRLENIDRRNRESIRRMNAERRSA